MHFLWNHFTISNNLNFYWNCWRPVVPSCCRDIWQRRHGWRIPCLRNWGLGLGIVGLMKSVPLHTRRAHCWLVGNWQISKIGCINRFRDLNLIQISQLICKFEVVMLILGYSGRRMELSNRHTLRIFKDWFD